MKYLSSILFVAATCILSWHEALSTVSKHGTVDLISTWGWHVSQWLIVILFTASGMIFGIFSTMQLFHTYKTDSSIFRTFGKVAVAGLAPALVIYQLLYPYLCEVVK